MTPPKAGYDIRRYRDADHSDLLRFLERVFQDLGREFLLNGKDVDIRDLQRVYLENRGSFHVVEHQSQVVGSVGVRGLSSEVAELKRLYLAREHRGVGLGSGLCEAAINEARVLGYRWLRLDTTLDATAALGLFRKCDFREIPRYNANPYAEVWMERTL